MRTPLEENDPDALPSMPSQRARVFRGAWKDLLVVLCVRVKVEWFYGGGRRVLKEERAQGTPTHSPLRGLQGKQRLAPGQRNWATESGSQDTALSSDVPRLGLGSEGPAVTAVAPACCLKPRAGRLCSWQHTAGPDENANRPHAPLSFSHNIFHNNMP